MTNLQDLPELEDINKSSKEDNEKVILQGDGIDLNMLRGGKDTFFEVDPSSVELNEEFQRNYFDDEELFKQCNLNCDSDDDGTIHGIVPSFDQIKKDMIDLTGDGGVLKKVIKPGAGVIVPPKSICRLHYNANLEYSDEPFDSSRMRRKQTQFKLGCGEGILGWQIAVASMKRGELSRFLFDYNYAYGKMGCPPRIPAEAQVLFEIELVSFVDAEAYDDFQNFSEEERKHVSFDEVLQVVNSIRGIGNDMFKLNQIARAVAKYSQALRLLENSNLKDEAEENQMKDAKLKLCLNLSLCDIKLAKYGRACKYARCALSIDKENIKALYRLSRALRMLSEYEAARKEISKAQRLDPSNSLIRDELKKLDEEIHQSRSQEREMYKKMLKISNQIKSNDATANLDEKKVEQNQMVQLIQERLLAFKNEQDLNEITIPNNLTPDELASVQKIASEMKLYVRDNVEFGKSLIVTKKATKLF